VGTRQAKTTPKTTRFPKLKQNEKLTHLLLYREEPLPKRSFFGTIGTR
jgi:hypothetical protein